MKVFISGPMKGCDEKKLEEFDLCEAELRKLGYSVFNPYWCKYGKNTEFSRKDMLAIDICALSKCDAICFLSGSMNSNGSMFERHFAGLCDMEILHFIDGEIVKEDALKEGTL